MSLAIEDIKKQIWQLLKSVPDPEIPVINIVELGVVRNVDVTKNGIEITITPTYSGCPAMKLFENEIVSNLKQQGYKNITIKMIYSPAWTTDWLSNQAKQKLKEYGIAPPKNKKEINVNCPQCNSSSTEVISEFGSTACKALYRCKNCLEPFDYFKCI